MDKAVGRDRWMDRRPDIDRAVDTDIQIDTDTAANADIDKATDKDKRQYSCRHTNDAATDKASQILIDIAEDKEYNP